MQAFPFLQPDQRRKQSTISSSKILPFSNLVYSISSSVNTEQLESAASNNSIPFAIIGTALSTALALIIFKLQGLQHARHQALTKESRTDGLTGIANRREWDSRIRSCEIQRLENGHSFTVAIIDLNGFKALNDSLGHDYGDKILIKTGEALREICRASDLAARIGGDEFAILFQNNDHSPEASFEQRIIHALQRREVNASVGIASTSKTISLRDAWTQADQQMYSVKRAPGHSV